MYILWVFQCFLKESLITSGGLNDVIKKVQGDYFKRRKGEGNEGI